MRWQKDIKTLLGHWIIDTSLKWLLIKGTGGAAKSSSNRQSSLGMEGKGEIQQEVERMFVDNGWWVILKGIGQQGYMRAWWRLWTPLSTVTSEDRGTVPIHHPQKPEGPFPLQDLFIWAKPGFTALMKRRIWGWVGDYDICDTNLKHRC